MHVLEPKELESRRNRRSKKQSRVQLRRRIVVVLLLVIVSYSSLVMVLPVPRPQVSALPLQLPKASVVNMPWPSYGQAAIGAVGYGLLDRHGPETPVPMASTNKILTALAILETKPLIPGQPGPNIKITEIDVDTYNRFVSEQQSVFPVAAGEELTQYQALQVLLLPSANNVADLLVKWAFGSTEEYLKFANSFAKRLGMSSTTVADASGFSPLTVSNAVDLAMLAEAALSQPIVSEIVGQAYADLPTYGRVYNTNVLLNREGVIGIKTGNTDEAGGCFMFASKRNVDSANTITIYGAIVGAPNLQRAVADSLPLMNISFAGFKSVSLVRPGQVMGAIRQAEGLEVPIIADNGLSIITWSPRHVVVETELKKLGKQVATNQLVGTHTVVTGNKSYPIRLKAKNATTPVSPLWRLRHAAGHL